jgi:hypothetical protein
MKFGMGVHFRDSDREKIESAFEAIDRLPFDVSSLRRSTVDFVKVSVNANDVVEIEPNAGELFVIELEKYDASNGKIFCGGFQNSLMIAPAKELSVLPVMIYGSPKTKSIINVSGNNRSLREENYLLSGIRLDGVGSIERIVGELTDGLTVDTTDSCPLAIYSPNSTTFQISPAKGSALYHGLEFIDGEARALSYSGSNGGIFRMWERGYIVQLFMEDLEKPGGFINRLERLADEEGGSS